jgi:SAM-dependent methyltransferase
MENRYLKWTQLRTRGHSSYRLNEPGNINPPARVRPATRVTASRCSRYDADMPHPSWNDSYASGEPLPWDSGTPDPMLVEMIESRVIAPGRTLEVGCGTGTNAIYLAQHAFEVVGVDISPLAVERACAKANGRCRFETVDFLNQAVPGRPFQFVFDRGCFHTFDEDHERVRFAENVAAALVDGGIWLSLIGSTEGPSREIGPPRRTAREVMNAIEPSLEIVQLRSREFGVCGEQLKAWLCLSRKRLIPAQPSSRH